MVAVLSTCRPWKGFGLSPPGLDRIGASSETGARWASPRARLAKQEQLPLPRRPWSSKAAHVPITGRAPFSIPSSTPSGKSSQTNSERPADVVQSHSGQQPVAASSRRTGFTRKYGGEDEEAPCFVAFPRSHGHTPHPDGGLFGGCVVSGRTRCSL